MIILHQIPINFNKDYVNLKKTDNINKYKIIYNLIYKQR